MTSQGRERRNSLPVLCLCVQRDTPRFNFLATPRGTPLHAGFAIRLAVAKLVGAGIVGTGAVGAVGFRQLQQVLYDFPVPEPD